MRSFANRQLIMTMKYFVHSRIVKCMKQKAGSELKGVVLKGIKKHATIQTLQFINQQAEICVRVFGFMLPRDYPDQLREA